MRTISTDSNNDIYLGEDGSVSIATDVQAVAETAVHYGKTLRNEMIQEYDLGVPFFIVSFGANVSVPQFEAAMKPRILEAPNVKSITSFETTQDGETLRYTAAIETGYGEVTING